MKTRIAISEGRYSQHFQSGVHSLGEDGALEFVQGIVDERLAVATLFDDEAVAYTTMDTGAGPTSGEPHPYKRMRVRSWNGTFDADPWRLAASP